MLSEVAESWAVGLRPHNADAISIVPAMTAAASNPLTRIAVGRLRPGEQPVERVFADDEPAEPPVVVEVVRVPFAEDVVGPAVGRMVVVVGSRVQGQLVEQRRVELGVVEQVGVGRRDDFQRQPHDGLIRARSHTDAAQIERNRPEPLVIVHLARRPILQDGNRPIADEIVQAADGVRGQPLRRHVARCTSHGQHRFAGPGQEKWREQIGIRPGREQVGMVPAVSRGQFANGGLNRGPRLTDLAECRCPLFLQGGQLLVEQVGEPGEGVSTLRLFRRQQAGRVKLPLKPRVRPSLAVIQIAEQTLPVDRRARRAQISRAKSFSDTGGPLCSLLIQHTATGQGVPVVSEAPGEPAAG